MWLEWLTVLLSPWSWKHQEDPGWVWLECGISLGRSCHAMGIFLYLPLQVPWLNFFCSTTQYATCRVRAGTQGALLKLWLHCGCQAAAQPRPDNGGYLHSPNSLVPLQTGMQCSLVGATIQNFGAWADQHETWMKHIETQHQPKCDPEATSPNVLLRSAMKQSWQSQRNC